MALLERIADRSASLVRGDFIFSWHFLPASWRLYPALDSK
jgi:hypothetical protein